MNKITFLLAICLTLAVTAGPSSATTSYTILSSAGFSRTTGKPIEQIKNFASPFPDPQARLVISNGDGSHRVSSATITLNGIMVASPSDFNNNVARIEKTVPISLGNNTLAVHIAGTPGDLFSITVIGTPPPPELSIASPLDQEYIDRPTVMVRGTVDTYAKYINISINGQRAEVNGHDFIMDSLALTPGDNLINVQVVDSFRNQDQMKLVVFNEQAPGLEWIELVPDDPAFFQPLDEKLKVIFHLQHEVNRSTASLTYDGPGTGTISAVGTDEYDMRFDTPGIYTLTYSVQDIQGSNYSGSTMISVMDPFNEDGWQSMKDITDGLNNIYQAKVGSMDIAMLRQQVLEAALANQNFSSVALSGDALCLVYKGLIPIILSLPDPDAPPTEGSSGGQKNMTTSSKSFNPTDLDRLLKTKKCPKCNLQGANLAGVDISGGNIEGADLRGANMKNANLRMLRADEVILESADLQNADLGDAILGKANLRRANLAKADLKEVILANSYLESTNFREANLSHACLRKANLQKANLQKAKMVAADLRKSNLKGANLYKADLHKASLQNANLQSANLQKADLRWAELEGADLRGADLRGAKVKHAFMKGTLLDNEGLKYAEKHGAQFTKDIRVENDNE